MRKSQGIEVKESSLHGMVIQPARVETRTVWKCGACGTSRRKPGNHLGCFKRCRRCGAGGWLRAQ